VTIPSHFVADALRAAYGGLHGRLPIFGGCRPAFPSDDYRDAPVEVTAEAFRQYFGYSGHYEVDAGAATVTHFIDGAWLANLENTAQLILEAPTPRGRHP
jgi:Lipocalin-like domain